MTISGDGGAAGGSRFFACGRLGLKFWLGQTLKGEGAPPSLKNLYELKKKTKEFARITN